MDIAGEPSPPSNDNSVVKRPATLEEIERLTSRIDCDSVLELEIIKKNFEKMLNTPSWIAFYLISDAINKIDRIIYKKTTSPEKLFAEICSVVSYINNCYEINQDSGGCLVKRESNYRNINSFRSLSFLYI